MGQLKILLCIVIFAIVQIFLSKYKKGKWILPCMSFVLSISLMLWGLSFAVFMRGKEFFKELGGFNLIRLFLTYNIPTIIFLLINRYRRINRRNK